MQLCALLFLIFFHFYTLKVYSLCGSSLLCNCPCHLPTPRKFLLISGSGLGLGGSVTGGSVTGPTVPFVTGASVFGASVFGASVCGGGGGALVVG